MNAIIHALSLSLLLTGTGNRSNMERVSLSDLESATGGSAIGFASNDVDFRGVGIDSRTLRTNDLFWAVRGESRDGHEFVADAILGGAAGVVAEPEKVANVIGPIVQVRDSLEALWNFAGWYRRQHDALLIGVTGSVGKTTTREMIHAALSAEHSGVRSPKNYNNHFGLPLSLLEIESNHEFAVLELGASHIGEIRDLASLACPEIGVVTAIGEAHVGEFGSLANIIQAKGELVESLPASGLAILAGDDLLVRQLADRAPCPVLFVGESEQNDIRACDVHAEHNTLSFGIDGCRYELAVTGRHHLTAALAAAAIGREIGMTDAKIAEGLRSYVPVAGRCRTIQHDEFTVIDDTYNANPRSMQAACHVLRDWKTGAKRMLIAGDMLELGDRSDALHRKLGQTAAACGIDRLLSFGNNTKQVVLGAMSGGMSAHNIAECHDLDSLLAVLDCWLETGDVVLVKGSRAMRMERVVEWLETRGNESLKGNKPRSLLRAIA